MHDLSGRPWDHWEACYRALSGGTQTMKDAGALPPHTQLVTLSSRRLNVEGGNPSICLHNDKLVVCIRQGHRNILGDLFDLELATYAAMTGLYAPSDRENNPCRLFSFLGELRAITVTANYESTVGAPQARQALLTLDGANVTAMRAVPSTRYEKNWMPCCDGDRLRLVYSTDPLIVLDEPFTVPVSAPVTGTLRGGTQLQAYDDGWLAVVHQVHPGPIYLNRFVKFSRDLTSAKVGAPWFLQRQGVETTGGLVIAEGRAILSYGIDDREAWIAEVSLPTIDATLV